MSEFLYIYRGSAKSQSPARLQQNVQRWVTWFRELGDEGDVKSPNPPMESAPADGQRQR